MKIIKINGEINRTFAWAVRSGAVVACFPETSTRLLFGSALQGVNWNVTVASEPNQPLVFCASPSDLDEHHPSL
ncbi:MAG: hypothetical protein KC592_02290 [Nitrospira sp.]|nr:hypothetical protein [Nitrospira sp.]